MANEPPIPVFGYRIYMLTNDGGDGKILSFESPRITLTGDECYRTLSSPFQGLTYAQVLSGIHTQGIPNSNNPNPDVDPNVFFYDITEPTGTGAYKPVADMNNVIPPGTGFLVSVFNEYLYDNINDPDDFFPKALDRIRGREHGDADPSTIAPAR